jgi:hypothetical protein
MLSNEILYSDRSSKVEQILIIQFFEKKIRTWLKFISLSCFMERTHEPLHLRQKTFRAVKDLGHIYKFYLNIIFCNEGFRYGNVAKFRSYVGTNGEPLYVKCCNLQCQTFVKFVTC